MKEASFYQKLPGKKVQCLLCNQYCRIEQGKRGICGVRENQGGILSTLIYGKAVAVHVDPIEKKPLYHFQPGTRSFSFATIGCNFSCKFCQNFEISQYSKFGEKIIGEDWPPEKIVAAAQEEKCASIAYTYTEPTIFYEYAYDTMKLAKEKGMTNVWVSNGFMNPKVIEELTGLMDAINVDLKSFREDFYRDICGGKLNPVKINLKLLKKKGIWVEVTTLLIPSLNDSEKELKGIAEFIRDELGEETPWHVSAFYPAYLMLDRPSTPASTLIKAREIGLKVGLKYVYPGNIPGLEGENTFCPKCKELVVKRVGYQIERRDKKGKCPKCGREIAGVWK